MTTPLYLVQHSEAGTVAVMAYIVESPAIGFVVDLVNGWANAVRHDVPGPDGPLFPDRSALQQRWGVALPPVGDNAVADWADRAYDVFAAAAEHRVTAANRLLDSLNLQPALGVDGLRWRCADRDATVGALLAAGLIRYATLGDPTLAHLGTCAGVRCRDAYVDHSQGRTRRYCSTRCQDRTKTHRRRART